MEIKIDTDALSNLKSNKNTNQIVDEMIKFHTNEIENFLTNQKNKYLINEYFSISIISFLIENSEEKSLIIYAEIIESFQTIYDFKPKDKVIIYSKNNDFFNRLNLSLQEFFKKEVKNNNNNDHDHENKNLINFRGNLNKEKSSSDYNSYNNNNYTDSDINNNNNTNNSNKNNNEDFNSFNLKQAMEIKIQLDENIFIPVNNLIECLEILYDYDSKNDNNNNTNNKLNFYNKLFFIFGCLHNIIKIYFFYYKKYKFNKWDSILINSPYFEESFLLSLLLNFIGLKSSINKTSLKNNYDLLSLNQINDYIFELENTSKYFENQKDKNYNPENYNYNNELFLNKKINDSINSKENIFFSNENLEYFLNNNNNYNYSNYNYSNNNNNNSNSNGNKKIEIISTSDYELKIKNLQKEESLNINFESIYFNYIFDTTGECLNSKNKIIYFNLMQNEGNIIVNDNINEKIQIDPRDITYMYNKSISINFINITKNLKFNISQGKLINFILDFLSKLIFVDDSKIKKILKIINYSVKYCSNKYFDFSIDEIMNKNNFYNLYIFRN
jgi:hypothetical protein